MSVDVAALHALAREIRSNVVLMSHRAHAPHLGSSLSCVDILVALYWSALVNDPAAPDASGRDRFIFSKGHAAAALYATLAARGFFPEQDLETFGRPGSRLAEHPLPRKVPGIEVATGSLGHGLPIALGTCLAGRIMSRSYRVFALMSDGECNEGSVWEAAMMAPAHRAVNLVAVIDFNQWQATGRSCEVMAMEPLAEKWKAFGWSAQEIDGHDMAALVRVLSRVPDGSGKPIAVIARTVKGKGVSFMEDDNNWHYRIPNEEEVRAALEELKSS